MKQNSSKMPTGVETLKFYKTKDMRDHEEKSRTAVKTFLENLNNRSKKSQHSTSTSITDKVSGRLSTSVLPTGTTSVRSTLNPTQRNIKTITQPSTKVSPTTSVRSASANSQSAARITNTQKMGLAQNRKASVDSDCTTTDIQYKKSLKFYKTKDMREHEEKSKWAVQTFWENLNNRSKKSGSANVSAEQVSGKDKTIGRSNKLSLESTSKASTQTFGQSCAPSSSLISQGAVEISMPDIDQPLTKFSNKRKHSGDGEISSKSIKITVPATRKQKEFSMKVNLSNSPAPKVNCNIQNTIFGTSKNNGVKSLVQLCTMTLVSNKHRLYQLGNVPYHLLEPILKFCTDEELRQLEEVNSRLIDEDTELWKRFLQQKLPDEPLPDNPEDYRKIYLSIVDEEREKKERIIGNFRRAMAKERAKKEARQVKILPVAPREPKRRPSGYQKLTTIQKIRRDMIREGHVIFPHHNT